MAPFGVPEIVAAVGAAGSVLDAGCGSARLTLALAQAGAAEVVGVDTSVERLEQGQARIATDPTGASVQLIEADFNRALPFPDGRFGAAVSRLALMIAADPVATLRELRRVTAPGGPIVTGLWAPIDDNPWFALPRAAAAAVLGPERAGYARAFGRLGGPEEAVEVHRAAGLADVMAETLRETLDVQDAAALWAWMVAENGHVRRLDAALSVMERAAVLTELERLAADHRAGNGSLRLPRTMTLVTATSTDAAGAPRGAAGPRRLDWDEIVAALGELGGSRVAVRMVERGAPEVLVAVLRGHLGPAPREKHPALFWPISAASEDRRGDAEDTGIYLRRDRFEPSAASPARDVLHIVQGPVIVNVRRV